MSERTVLVVDDEDDIREVIQMSLELVAGWTVHTASGGAEAVTKAAEILPDVILCDVMMPEMDGPRTFEVLRQESSTRSIPFVFLTAKIQRSELLDLHELGACGVIAKPFDPMTLNQQIDQMVRAS